MNETNPISDFPNYHHDVTDRIEGCVYWTEPGLKVVRLRFLSEPGFNAWDVSYCHGQLPNGKFVDVQLPFSQLKKFNDPINRQIVKFARADDISAKELGILDAISTFN